MKRIEALYQQILNIDDQAFYLIEADFCYELYYHIQDINKPLCVTAFLTLANWSASSKRSGVWTFYEAALPLDIDLTLNYLEQLGNNELTAIFHYGIHDYQNPIYAENYNYPNEWIDESEKIDQWITSHEVMLDAWKRKLLIDNKKLICSLLQ